jgi:hypothetical protein
MLARALPIFVASGTGLIGLAALPASADKPVPPTSLDGESFNGVPTFSNESCHPEGTSSFDYSASGVASGPYPGTFSETGSVTVGPQTIPGEVALPVGTLTYKTGPLATLEATFTIQSTLGVVTGTKTLVFGGLGACEDSAQFQSFAGTQTVPVLLRRAGTNANNELSYTATIPTSKKMYCDNGTSTLAMGEFIAGTLATLEAPNFTESFASGSVAPLHGHQSC